MDKKLYNLIFPTYMLVTFLPSFVLFLALVLNFLVDSLVILLVSSMVFKKIDLLFYKKVIVKVWGLGYLADFLAAAFLTFLEYIDIKRTINEMAFNLLGVVLAFIFIFIFNYFISFNKIEMNKKQKFLSLLILSILTAPYTFLIPECLFYYK